MENFTPTHEILDELREICGSDALSAELLHSQNSLSAVGDSSHIDGSNIIWDYENADLLPYTDEIIQELTTHQSEDPTVPEVTSIYYSEPSTSTDENTVLYEEITRARCIDCDKIVDISQSTEARKHSCEMFKKLNCEKCGSRFNSLQNLRVHNLTAHTRQEEFMPGTGCEMCEKKNKKKFQRFSAFVAHLKTHMKNDNFTCSTCGLEFQFSNLYNRHRRIAHGVGENTKRALSCSELGYCNKCDQLMEQTKVESHRRAHTAHLRLEKKAKTKERETEKQKKSGASANRRYCCEKCQKAFVRPAELKRHMGVHEKTDAWKCFQCNKLFSHQSGLRAHRKIAHGTDKPKFACHVCGMEFNKRSNCDRHVKDLHPLTTKKPMSECHLCSCQFKNVGTLNKHLAKVHKADASWALCWYSKGPTKVTAESVVPERISAPPEVIKLPPFNPKESLLPHKCFKCDKRFKLRSSLKVHLDVHARKEIDDPVLTDPKCPICLKHLSSKNNLRRHLLTHQNGYECPDCCQKFHSIHRLDRHKCYRAIHPNGGYQQDILVNPVTIKTSTIPSKSYFCKQCPSSFFSFRAFKEHKSLHSGLKPHLCWTCHKSFRTADLLAMHKEIHSKEPIYCEYCALVLYGRAHYSAHVRAVHHNRQTVLPSSSTLLPNRGAGISSSQSEYCADRGEPMEGFRTRAQSADMDPREMDGTTWIPMGNTETVQDRPLRCPLCSHQFASVAYLTQHFANTQNERDHSFTVVQCPLCDVSMQGSAEALQHFSTVHTYVFHDTQSAQAAMYGTIENATFEMPSEPAKKHKCSTCLATFRKPSDLVRHVRTHTGEKPFECDICNRRFSVRSSLNAHVKIHLRGDPEHECALCSVKFYKKSALALHLRLHTGEKPLKCRSCAICFRTSAARKAHENSEHNVQQKEPTRTSNEENLAESNSQKSLPHVVLSPPVDDNLTLTTVMDKGCVFPVAVQPQQNTVPAQNTKNSENIMGTLAQITRVEPTRLPVAKGSAFSKTVAIQAAQYIHITARRISITEYTVTVARKPPAAIREGIDTTASIALNTLKNLAEQDTPMRLTLMDNQQLNVMAKGVLNALGDEPQIVLRAHPFNPLVRFSVELLPPHRTDFTNRCDICDVDLPSKEISDVHFASEDHETAQVLHPLADAVQDTIDDSLMITPAVSHHRREEVTCKLCGRKFLDTEPLVAHIRLEHERDHPHSLAPRPIARTAPPLEASRHQTAFQAQL